MDMPGQVHSGIWSVGEEFIMSGVPMTTPRLVDSLEGLLALESCYIDCQILLEQKMQIKIRKGERGYRAKSTGN
jgi:hypothetical protein